MICEVGAAHNVTDPNPCPREAILVLDVCGIPLPVCERHAAGFEKPVSTVETIEHLDFDPVCEYINSGLSGDCGQSNPAVLLVWTGPFHCVPAKAKGFCASCWAKRNSGGTVTCRCFVMVIPCYSNVLRVERIKP